MKSTPVRGVKEYLKPYVYNPSEHERSRRAMACLLENEPTSYCSVVRLREQHPQPQRKQV